MKISSLIECLKAQYRQPHDKRRPIFAQGKPGVGKSAAFASAAEQLGIGFMSLQATIEDPITLSGLPARALIDEPPLMIRSDIGNYDANRAPAVAFGSFEREPTARIDVMPQRFSNDAVFLPFKDKLPLSGEGILVIDEINTAPPAVQAGLYDLFLHGKLGSYTLPAGWMVGATGNRDEDRAATQAIPMPLIGRWTRALVDSDLADWTKHYALQNGVRPEVVAFYQFKPELFDTFDPKRREPYSCPRTAVFASDILNSAPPGLEHELLCGTIGEGVATEMMAFIKVYRDMVSVEDILRAPEKAPVPTEPAAACAVAAALAYAASAQNIASCLIYVARMLKEYEVLFVTLATQRDMKLFQSQAFIRWASHPDNTSVVLG